MRKGIKFMVMRYTHQLKVGDRLAMSGGGGHDVVVAVRNTDPSASIVEIEAIRDWDAEFLAKGYRSGQSHKFWSGREALHSVEVANA